MEGSIYLIGGGEIASGETKVIDDQILHSVSKGTTLVFFPTAAGDSSGYIKAIESVFGNHLTVVAATQDKGEAFARSTIRSAAVIYLGGGKTEFLLELFERWQLIPVLRGAFQGGAVIAGMSAGAQALSAFYVDDEKEAITIKKGWGLADVCCLVHADELSSRAAFDAYRDTHIATKYPFMSIGKKAAWRIGQEKMSKVGDGPLWVSEVGSVDISLSIEVKPR